MKHLSASMTIKTIEKRRFKELEDTVKQLASEVARRKRKSTKKTSADYKAPEYEMTSEDVNPVMQNQEPKNYLVPNSSRQIIPSRPAPTPPVSPQYQELKFVLDQALQGISKPMLEQNKKHTQMLEETSHNSTIRQQENTLAKDLPKIQITSFNGDKANYLIFKQMFLEAYDQQSDKIKFRHLRSLLKLDAFERIAHIQPGPRGYTEIWEVLDKQYLSNINLAQMALWKRRKYQDQKRMTQVHWTNSTLVPIGSITS